MRKHEKLRIGPVRQDLRVGRLSDAVTHRLEEWPSSPACGMDKIRLTGRPLTMPTRMETSEWASTFHWLVVGGQWLENKSMVNGETHL